MYRIIYNSNYGVEVIDEAGRAGKSEKATFTLKK